MGPWKDGLFFYALAGQLLKSAPPAVTRSYPSKAVGIRAWRAGLVSPYLPAISCCADRQLGSHS